MELRTGMVSVPGTARVSSLTTAKTKSSAHRKSTSRTQGMSSAGMRSRASAQTAPEKCLPGSWLPDPEAAASMLCEAMIERGFDERVHAALARVAFAGIAFDVEGRLFETCRSAAGWFDFDPREYFEAPQEAKAAPKVEF